MEGREGVSPAQEVSSLWGAAHPSTHPRISVLPFLSPQYCIWLDGLNALLGKDMASELTKSDLDTLLSMEMKLRLLDLENIHVPEVPPPLPKEPSSYDFVYHYG